ncbi:hypothetical protein [Crocinitomix catalasitica]|uniref:hypothetical protein n=1 Tax=Crocinitomix catalasitica TaxID=184607 RepID=UPI000480C8EF|nr:hypothetical protein [Crocinitomix catalasitica]
MKYLVVFLFSLFSWHASAQYDIDKISKDSTEKESRLNPFKIKEKIFVGGEAGLSFGSYGSYVFLAPIVGYDITEKFSTGISAMYQFNSYANYRYHTYGGGIFTRFMPIPQLIIQAEIDLYNGEDYSTFVRDRTNTPALLGGIGYANYFTNDTYAQILVMYDFIGDPNMPLPFFLVPRLYLKFGLIWHLN